MDFLKQRWVLVVGGLLFVLFLCGVATVSALLLWRPMARGPATPTVDWMGTQIAATLSALPGTASSPTSSLASSPTSPLPTTATPAVTDTPAPTDTPVPSPTPRCLAARFVTDVTVPDGTVFAPNTPFTKTWRLRNVGACTWTTAFVVYFDEGDAMGAPAQVNLPHAVEPDETVDVSVDMQAPSTPGTYKGYWKLRSDTGQSFGIGAEADRPFWVEIEVVAPSPTPTPEPPSAVTISIPYDPANSGTLYQTGEDTIGGSVIAGDTSTNVQARGYFTFDISGVSGTVLQAELTLTCSRVRNPFTDLLGIWLAEVEYALPLRPLHFGISGQAITLLEALPGGPIDVTGRVAADVADGDPYFQIRMHPKRPTDNDGQADYMMCGNAVLHVTYQP